MSRKPQVVVVDDNPATGYSTRRVLENAGFEVALFDRGQDALQRIGPDTDVALLDINLPDLDGIEICRRLRARSDTAQLGIVHLTATRMQDADRVEGLDAGADAYLVHPVHPQVLLATIRALLRARAAENAMRDSEAKFRGIFDQAPCGIAVLDRELRFLDANPQMQRLLDRDLDTLRGCRLGDFVASGASFDSGTIDDALRRGGWSGIVAMRGPDDEHSELEWTISPRLDAGEVLCIVNDVTTRKRLEFERERVLGIEREARSEAERNARAKDEFLATLSHELRNPLAPIRNALYLLQLSPASGAVADKARDVMVRQVEHMTRLVDDLMDVSRITRGLVHLERRRVPLRAILDSAIEASLPQVESAGHHLVVNADAGDAELVADPVRLAQVFTNVLNNAAKYTPAGGRISVTTRMLDGAVEVAVEDNGIGISDDMLERIFDVFTQINPGPVSAGGLGIGLTLVRRLVEMHGGRVAVTSGGAGCGSRFTVELPLAGRDAAPAPAAARPAGTEPASGCRAIVIDDNRDAAESLCELLVALGHHCECHIDAVAGIRAVEATLPDLVFIDIGMPRVDGFEVARRLKAQPATRHIPLIAITGWGAEEDRRRSQAAGFDRHLTKPVALADLQRTLDEAAAAPLRH